MRHFIKFVLAVSYFTIAAFFSGCLKGVDQCSTKPNLHNIDQTQLEADIETIDAYLAEKDIERVQKHPSGLRYVVTNEGSGSSPKLCDQVTLIYLGKLMANNDVFDQSSKPVSAPLNELIYGWQLGIPLVKKEGSITLYVPSVYAYGDEGTGENIPANANLIFDIKLLDIN